jgi:hypothetical protein
MVKTSICFHKDLGSILDGCMHNISCTNVIYKHIHHGEYKNMYMLKWCQSIFVEKIGKKNFNVFSRHVNLSRHAMTTL